MSATYESQISFSSATTTTTTTTYDMPPTHSLFSAALATLATPSYPSPASTASASANAGLVNPVSAAVAFGLAVSIGIALTISKTRRSRLVDAESSSVTTATGVFRRRSTGDASPDDDLKIASFFAHTGEADDDAGDMVSVPVFWFWHEPVTRGPYHPTSSHELKTATSPQEVKILDGDTHSCLTTAVEDGPEVLDVDHMFYGSFSPEDGDDNSEDSYDYAFWLDHSPEELPTQNFKTATATLTEGPTTTLPCSAQIEKDELSFGYLFAVSVEDDEEEKEAVDHDLDEISGVHTGYLTPTAPALDTVGGAPLTATAIRLRTLSTPSPTICAREIVDSETRSATVPKAPSRSSSGVLSRTPFSMVNVKRSFSLKTFGLRHKADKGEDKGKDKVHRSDQKENSKLKSSRFSSPARFVVRSLSRRVSNVPFLTTLPPRCPRSAGHHPVGGDDDDHARSTPELRRLHHRKDHNAKTKSRPTGDAQLCRAPRYVVDPIPSRRRPGGWTRFRLEERRDGQLSVGSGSGSMGVACGRVLCRPRVPVASPLSRHRHSHPRPHGTHAHRHPIPSFEPSGTPSRQGITPPRQPRPSGTDARTANLRCLPSFVLLSFVALE
ncbi:hypothetical protein MVEN_01789000 [Mycena venus]|uniref:Uncharacterized protein n=1 Tax=Mycena venus TaxID=2733690 RepID=A0A8H6XI91_9AGAR|nr:hypothetical protein MVEN_01789000 [Mycena venus]